ncbi:MAG: hypothetical protein A2921_00815 [Candidatus Magasanikbacteria bacterium RIFCSPLOWO2_01_FULL_43_20b]|uniref:Uncharacterized protein n=1 Tax=Candidatus Magasanikbacteria bacterium RIFCSPLOWO2_12_FULL_43_12 TaxID=1798692 RepID=A0A1F6MV87_9BACT|nr:MAG: hypothetical protein A3I93_00535 [Candidatus Magasanikbacteria bacterium RIFCSPLOWO2_02_FULL_43_22]OGH72820.1 MAG: hypothetical protein A2921_00815 [Candidatus Magasanikbacteria bacterium RIFCSPLOWO2_01_FULL_43_20b]OGH75616.1 MAG: hypothetical protein A3G00_03930 [Candidatus Magasanikbacteria bacterium RIFCSPLOWO2_12_FULL_43_12]
MKKSILTTILIISAGLVLTTVAVNAQGLKDAASKFDKVAGSDGAKANVYENPEDVIGVGIGAAITLVGMIFLVLMVYAGYLWMTARGEQEQVDKAQKIITAALIGFFIVASAYAITTFVSGKLGGGSTEQTNETSIKAGCAFDATKAADYCGKIKESDSEQCDQQKVDGEAVCDWSSIDVECEVEVSTVADICASVYTEEMCSKNVCKWIK